MKLECYSGPMSNKYMNSSALNHDASIVLQVS